MTGSAEPMGNKSKTKRAVDGQAVLNNKRVVRVIKFAAMFVAREHSEKCYFVVS